MRIEWDNVLPADLEVIILAHRSNIEYGHNLDPELMNRYIVVMDSMRTTFCPDDALLMKYPADLSPEFPPNQQPHRSISRNVRTCHRLFFTALPPDLNRLSVLASHKSVERIARLSILVSRSLESVDGPIFNLPL